MFSEDSRSVSELGRGGNAAIIGAFDVFFKGVAGDLVFGFEFTTLVEYVVCVGLVLPLENKL